MLVVPPRSQVLKLNLTYQQWEVLAKGLQALAIVAAKQGSEANVEGVRFMQREVDAILAQLRKEGHI